MFAVEVSPVTGVVVALMVGLVPIVVASGVTGTRILILSPAGIGPGLVHVTMRAKVLQVEPLLVKVAGADVPAGNVIVVVMIPGAGLPPMFLTTTGTLLGVPTTNGVKG